MGFFSGLKKAFSSVAPYAGAAIGGFYGGPGGAALGYSAGQAVGGGLTKPSSVSGSEQGRQARDYFDEAYPGTTAWERLGTSSPMASVAIAAKQVENTKSIANQQQSVQHKGIVQQYALGKQQLANQKAIAKIGARSAAVAAGGTLGINNIKAAGDYATGDDSGASGVRGISTQRVTAEASQEQARVADFNAWTSRRMSELKGRELDIKTGEAFKDPASARLASLASQAFQMGMRQDTFIAWMKNNPKKLIAMGVGVQVGKGVSKILSTIFGRLKVSGGRAARSVPGRPQSYPGKFGGHQFVPP